MNYNEQAKRIHELNKQWWHDKNGNRLERNKGELLMLVVSELSEGLEALRKDLMDDHLPHRKGIEVELADAAIRLLDYSAGFDLDIQEDGFFVEPDTKNEAQLLLYHVGDVVSAHKHHDEEHIEEFFIEQAINAIFAHGKKYGYDIEGAMEEKLIYNQQRADHRIENRMKKNGKKF